MNKYKSLLVISMFAAGSMTVNAGSTLSMAETPEAQIAIDGNDSADEETDVRNFITKFYSEIIPLVNNIESYDDIMKRYFSQEFIQIYTTVDEDVPDGEMGFFDYDIISNSQDPDLAKAVIKNLILSVDSSNNTIANAKISLMSKKYAPTPIDLLLTKTSEGWRICDYNNVLADMKEFKKEMKNLK